MTQQSNYSEAPPPLPSLKVEEPQVNPDDPWDDDMLGRREIADRLTSIVRGQEAPFVISIDGRWGTGKTFLLKRWVQDLRNQDPKWQAIYFNAWEDDSSKDPLLAIIGQLSGHFGEGLFREVAAGAAGAALNILSNKLVGMKLGELTPESLFQGYRDQQATQRAVKERLAELGARVRQDTNQPLVFVIDELDRCRPTFAIELLERVKHLFDVKNIVFVFGINRSELVKSLESVYGEIDAGTYLRRFFDMEFVLPDADPARFCMYLFDEYRLSEFFLRLSGSYGTNQRIEEIRALEKHLSIILGSMGLSLRDVDYCVRLLSLAGRDLERQYPLHPALLAILVAMKIKEPALYRRFVTGSARGAEVIDYLNGQTPAGVDRTGVTRQDKRGTLELVHAAVYAADNAQIVRTQLDRLREGSELDRPGYLSEGHARLGPDDSDRLLHISGLVRDYDENSKRFGVGLGFLAERIDLYSDLTRGG